MGGGTGSGYYIQPTEELVLSKVNTLSVKVVYDPNDETFTIMPEHGLLRCDALSAGEHEQFLDVARIHLERIIAHFMIEVTDPQIVEVESADSEMAAYSFKIVST